MSSGRILGAVVSVVVGLSLTGCGVGQNPCAKLAPPTPEEISVASNGTEIEKEVGDYECELVDGVWQVDQDSNSSVGKTQTTTKPKAKTTTKPKITTGKSK